MSDRNEVSHVLEGAIKAEIEKENVKMAIDQVIRDMVTEETSNTPQINPELVVSRLLESPAIQSLLHRVNTGTSARQPPPAQHSNVDLSPNIKEKIIPGRRYLYVHVIGGRAFVDHVGCDRVEHAAANLTSLVVNLSIHNQRYMTKGIRCVCEPKINEGFLFDLQSLKSDLGSILDSQHLLTLDAPLNIIVARRDGLSGAASTLLSVHSLEWRSVLTQVASSKKFSCQLMGIGSEQQVPVGLLDLEVMFIPPLETTLPNPTVLEYLEGTKKRMGDRRRLFITYARQWWQEYTEMAPSHSSRPVKIFAMDEYGRNRFVCEFLRPMEVGRALHSPEEAARWVSLIPSPPAYQIPAGCNRPWYNISTALISQLDVESRCVLLCSILLGFGMNAFICVGTRKAQVPHLWVMTKGPYSAVTFWETVTGCRYLHRIGQKGAHDYETVGSVFNNKNFYASCQASDKIEYCSFILEDKSAWKMMSLSATSSVTQKSKIQIPLKMCTNDDNKRSSDLEVQLKILIIEHRSDSGLSTNFDDHLSYMLTPALWSYEKGAIDGNYTQEVGSPEHFSAALMHTIPEGYTFKAYPLHFIHNSPRRAFTSVLNSGIGREIVECRGDRVSLAVRVIVVSYPENISVTWIMVACSFRPIG